MSYALADLLAYCNFKVKRADWVEGTFITSTKTIWGTKKLTLYRDGEPSTNYSPTESDLLANDWEEVPHATE